LSDPVIIKVELKNRYGLHARPAALFVQMCNKYASEVTVVHNNMRVSGKNILDIMTLGAEPGCELTLEIDGEDAQEAAESLAELVNNKFGEA